MTTDLPAMAPPIAEPLTHEQLIALAIDIVVAPHRVCFPSGLWEARL